MNNSCLPEYISSEGNCGCLLTNESAFWLETKENVVPKGVFCVRFEVGPLLLLTTCLLQTCAPEHAAGSEGNTVTPAQVEAPCMMLGAAHPKWGASIVPVLQSMDCCRAAPNSTTAQKPKQCQILPTPALVLAAHPGWVQGALANGL